MVDSMFLGRNYTPLGKLFSSSSNVSLKTIITKSSEHFGNYPDNPSYTGSKSQGND